jgi:pyruvate/2-oxoglutarate dehydrogenase complex dihydrolipoamide dehydrogenase (E3) component
VQWAGGEGKGAVVEKSEVVVIGMGPGGEEVAGRLAEAGLDVVGIERELLGGECPYWGCVPSKMMIRAANLLAEAKRVTGQAGTASVTPDWAPVAARIRKEATDSWNDKVAVDRFEGKGGRFVRGAGRLVGGNQVEVDGRKIEASRAIVLATGTTAAIPPVPGLSDAPYWTNRQAIEAETLPRSLVVLGGGAIGVELAQVFARFGVEVTVLEALDRLLPPEEPEAGALIADVLEREGVRVLTSARAVHVAHGSGGFTLSLEGGGTIDGDQLLVATGRKAQLGVLGLDKIGIDGSGRWVPVDGRMRVGPGVWAVGDLTGAGAFTHVAMYQAGIAAADILGQDPPPADYRALPRVTFSDPEIGSVGLSAERAVKSGARVRIGVSLVPSSARGWIHKAGNEGFVKLVEDAARGVLVGATSAGPAGGEVLSMLTLAIHAEVPVSELRRMIYAYPTFHRAVEDALRSLA